MKKSKANQREGVNIEESKCHRLSMKWRKSEAIK